MTILTLSDLSYSFKNNHTPIISRINYTLYPGDFVILLGSNGSGKSTLLKLLYKEHRAPVGQIKFLDRCLSQISYRELSQKVSVLTQNYADSLFTSLTVYENYLLAHAASPLTQTPDRKSLMTHLMPFNAKLINKLDVTVENLSGGEKQALALALCLLKSPKLLLLDEHTSALDPKTSDQIMQLTKSMIMKYQITCLLTTHDLDVALRYGNRILILRDGQILQTFDKKVGPPLSKEMLLKFYY